MFPDWQSKAAALAWRASAKSLCVGETVSGKVISRAPFGVWLDIGVGRPALLLVVNMQEAARGRIAFNDYPQKGTALTAEINALGDRGEIGLTQGDI